MEKVTVDIILNTLQKWVEEKQPIDSHTWLDACMKLTLLQGDEQGKLFRIRQKLSEQKMVCIGRGDTGISAKTYIESLDMFVEAEDLEAKIDRITELVRISKIQARMSNDQLMQN